MVIIEDWFAINKKTGYKLILSIRLDHDGKKTNNSQKTIVSIVSIVVSAGYFKSPFLFLAILGESLR